MVKIVVLSDTHLPKRARQLPAALWREIDLAEIVFHAGDWVDSATLDAISARASRLVAVFGNNDGDDLRRRLPEVARTTVDGLEIAVVHETGVAPGREERMDALYPGIDVLFFGHSH